MLSPCREEAHAATSGFSHSRCVRYNSQKEAEAAWEQAVRSRLVGPIDKDTRTLSSRPPQPESFWIVLRGRKPGVYTERCVLILFIEQARSNYTN